MIKRLLGLCLILLALRGDAFAHGATMLVGSSEDRGGQLRIGDDFDFADAYVLEAGVSVGGFTFFSNTIPSFAWVIDSPTAGGEEIYPLKANTQVRLELLAITDRASLRLNSTRLTAPGQSALIGTVSTDPEAHTHPEWQLTLADGVVGNFQVDFQLTTTTRGYTTSPVYRITLTNQEPTPTPSPTSTSASTATPTPTPEAPATPTLAATNTVVATPTETETATPTRSATPTASPTEAPTTPPPCAGDCNADRAVTVDELVKAVNIALGSAGIDVCPAADRNADELITVDEIVASVQRALNGCD